MMSGESKNWFRQEVERFSRDPEFVTESLLIQVNEQLCLLMEREGISRAELAQRLGCTRAYVTRVLNGMPNLSLQSLVKLVSALNGRVQVRIAPLGQTAGRSADYDQKVTAGMSANAQRWIGEEDDAAAIAA